MAAFYEKILVPKDKVDLIEPFDDQIIVKVIYPEEKVGGILLTGNTIERESFGKIFGTVVKAGPKCFWAKAEDDVIFAKFAGVCVYKQEDEGNRYELRIMPETTLIAKIGAIK